MERGGEFGHPNESHPKYTTWIGSTGCLFCRETGNFYRVVRGTNVSYRNYFPDSLTKKNHTPTAREEGRRKHWAKVAEQARLGKVWPAGSGGGGSNAPIDAEDDSTNDSQGGGGQGVEGKTRNTAGKKKAAKKSTGACCPCCCCCCCCCC